MQKIKYKIFFLIIFFSFVTRFFNLGKIINYYFDEQYHVPAAKMILNGDVRVFEWWHNFSDLDYPMQNDQNAVNNSNFDWLHPPLAKYFQAFSMMIFGEKSFGWRFPSVIFGVAIIILVYFIGKNLFNEKAGLIALFFSSMSGLLLVQSRIAMNDVFVSFWILISLFFYWKARRNFFVLDVSKKLNERKIFLMLTGICLGLGLVTKWSAFFILIYLLMIEITYLLKNKKKNLLRNFLWSIYCLIAIPFLIYFLCFVPMFIAGKNLSDFYNLHENIFKYQFGGGGKHLYQSRPLDWFINARAVWYWKDVGDLSPGKVANIYLIENPLLSLGWVVAVFMTVINLFAGLRKKLKSNEFTNINFIFFGYLFSFLPWIFSPRIMFYYHYLPAVGLVNILLAYWVIRFFSFLKKKNEKLAKILFLFLILLFASTFGVYYGHWTGYAIPSELVEKVFFLIEGWR